MKNTLLYFLLLVVNGYVIYAQSNPYRTVIKQEAGTMAKLLLKNDKETFSELIYPTIIQKIRRNREAILLLRNNKDSITIKNITYGNPSRIIQYKGELQCTITETIQLQVKNKIIIMHSILIAISKDQGKKWYFIEANQDLKTLQQGLPNLSDSLVIPISEQTIIQDM